MRGPSGSIKRGHRAWVQASSLAHSSAETYRHFDLFRCKLAGEVSTGHVRCVEARTLHWAGPEVKPPQIGLAKVTVGEIDACDVHSA
jgi:hypothetical protein